MTKVRDLPRAQRRAAERVIASMGPVDRAAWDEMAAEDEDTLILCLQVQHENGGVFDLDGIKKHFRLSRILMGQSA